MHRLKLVLASASPRRRDLLHLAGFSFVSESPEFTECIKPGESADAYIRRNAYGKAYSVWQHRLAQNHTLRPVIGADTVVVHEDQIMEKPLDRAQARSYLRRLSGTTHHVLTAFCIFAGETPAEPHVDVVRTDVLFRTLRSSDIDTYLETCDWMDKAGGYSIQGHAAHFIQTINGSYTNVVGLPMAELCEALYLKHVQQ